MADNPFKIPREARSETLTVRLTPTEHASVKAIADREGVDIAELVRQGLAHVVDDRSKRSKR